jgi:hypothetical protein
MEAYMDIQLALGEALWTSIEGMMDVHPFL